MTRPVSDAASNSHPVAALNGPGRGKVKADDIADVVDEQRVCRQLECLATVWLQADIRRIVAWEKPVSAAIERIDYRNTDFAATGHFFCRSCNA